MQVALCGEAVAVNKTGFRVRAMLVLFEKREWYRRAASMLGCGCPGPAQFVYFGGRWEEVDVARSTGYPMSSVLTDPLVAADLNSLLRHPIGSGGFPR